MTVSHEYMQHKNTDLHHYDSQYTVSTGTQHQYPLSVQQSSHDKHLYTSLLCNNEVQ